MSYKFNPLVSLGLDQVANYTALNLLGTVANQAALPGGATTGDVYQAEDTGIFYVWDGAAWDSIGTLAGPAGPTGATGADGADGVGVPTGGSTGQALVKASATDYDTQWSDVTAVAALDDLTDVTIATPSDGQVLEYDAVAGAWVNAAPSGGGGTPGGADTQVQFNDGGAFGGDAGLTYNKTTDELTVAGDINLDDGGTFSTTVQSVTPTANRTISFPDATGTVALVSGSNGTIQYNDAGTLKGNSDFTVDVDWDNPSTTFTALKVNVPDATQGASDSKLLDLQVGGTSNFNVTSRGELPSLKFAINSANPSDPGSTGRPAFYCGSSQWLGLSFYGQAPIASFHRGSSPNLTLNVAAGDSYFGIGNSSSSSAPITADVRLHRDSAGILAQRNGTNAQTYRLYNTWGNNGVDFERTSLIRDSSGLVIDAQKGGTGVDPTNLLDVKLGGASYFSTSSSGSTTISGPNIVNSTGLILKEGFNGVSNTYISFRNYLSQDVARISAIPGRFRFSVNDFAGGTSREMLNLIGSGHRMLLNQDLSLEWRDTAGDSWSAAGTADTGLARDSAGVVKITDGSTGTGYVKQTPVLVSALPAAATVGAGTRGFVSDATATTFASVVTGSGTASTAGTVPVYSDGTDWRIG